MYSTRRKSGTRWSMIFIFGLFLLTGLFIFLALNSEPINRRIQALPYYARTYINKFRPNVEMPAPPAESAIAPNTLLETRLNDEASAQSSDTPPYFNEETLNPNNQGNEAAGSFVVVESSTLAPAPIAAQINLPGVTHEWQTWNNCGPSTIAMNLSYYGRTETQVDTAQFLKPNREDKNVSPNELAAYAQSLGFGAVTRVGGDPEPSLTPTPEPTATPTEQAQSGVSDPLLIESLRQYRSDPLSTIEIVLVLAETDHFTQYQIA